MFTVGQALINQARRSPDKVALIFGEDRRTYRQLEERAHRMANVLRDQGLRKGDRVALLLPNGLQMAEAYFAVALAGLVGVPLNLRWTAHELVFALQDADVSCVLMDEELSGFPGLLSEWPIQVLNVAELESRMAVAQDTPLEVSIDQDDPWVIVYTSGTTGQPKGAVRSHYSNIMVALTLISELGITRDDIGFAILPMFHVNSMWFVTLSVAIGATCVIYPHRSFHPQHVAYEMNKHDVTYSMFVPSLLSFLADSAEAGKLNTDSLKVMMTSSAPLDSTLRDRILKGFPNVRLYDIYGSTEYGAVTAIRHRLGGPLGSVGYPVIGQELKILDEARQSVQPGTIGEIFVRGPSLMTKYFRRPDANRENTTDDGFVTVGDMGYVGGEGLVYLVDRKEDMIIVAGENVYPAEVEDVLLRSPDVSLAAVVGIPEERRGERVLALVVPRPGYQVRMDRLEELCREYLADYKRPFRIEAVPDLPMGPAAKVVRRLARERWLKQNGVG